MKHVLRYISGPTATGKSSVALALCKDLGGEIVSCDSVQVYRDVFVGCNKPSEEEMKEVRHHLVGVASLEETFTAGTCIKQRYLRVGSLCRVLLDIGQEFCSRSHA